MSPTRSRGSVSERLAAAAAGALIGRSQERFRLATLLAPDGPAAVFVHGPGGIGKTALVTGTLAGLPLTCPGVDGGRLAPTGPRRRTAVGDALGTPAPPSAGDAAEQITAAGIDVLVIDGFERLNLLD